MDDKITSQNELDKRSNPKSVRIKQHYYWERHTQTGDRSGIKKLKITRNLANMTCNEGPPSLEKTADGKHEEKGCVRLIYPFVGKKPQKLTV